MNIKYILIGFAALVVVSCSSDTKSDEGKSKTEQQVQKVYTEATMQKEIGELEVKVMSPGQEQASPLRERLIGFYLSYAEMFPNDSLTPDMVFKAGNQAVNLEHFEEAIGYYNRVVKNYRDYLKRPEAMYMIGFVNDAYLDKKGAAKEAYEELIQAYPKHILAEQAALSIEALSLTDEELIRKFETENES